jgi:hypothetical protein
VQAAVGDILQAGTETISGGHGVTGLDLSRYGNDRTGRFAMNHGVWRCRIAGILLSGVTLTAAAGKIYEWTDAAGRLNYSDIPPRDAPTQSRKMRPDTTGATGTAGLRPVELEII